jgi:phosphoglycolate phosphatase
MKKTRRYRAMLFDLDGTLIDSKIDIADATNAIIERLGGQTLPRDLINRFVGRGVRDLVKNALAKVPHVDIEQALATFNAHYLKHCCDHTRFYPGVENTLAELRVRGIGLAVLTNKPQKFADKILVGLGATGWFGAVIGAEEGSPHKPARGGADAALAALGISPADALMVGDSVVDLQTAQNTGMDCALMLYGFSPRAEIEALRGQAAFLCEGFDELLRWVR